MMVEADNGPVNMYWKKSLIYVDAKYVLGNEFLEHI